MATIQVDDDVYQALQARAVPFVDTPNDVLRRLLGIDGETSRTDASKSTATVGARRAPSGALLPEREYELPLLESIVELGGAAPMRDVVDRLEAKIASKLTPLDREQLPTGGIRWRNRAQFVRLRLIERGDLAADSRRGIWAVTEQGRERLGGRVRGTARRRGT